MLSEAKNLVIPIGEILRFVQGDGKSGFEMACKTLKLAT
jgi:hypothetical protein